MRLAVVLVIASACGRVSFDPLSDGGSTSTDGGGSNRDGGGSGTDGGLAGVACLGGTPSCTSTAGSLSLAGTYQAGNTTVQSGNGLSGSCGGANANELTIRLIALSAGTYSFDTAGSQFDTVVYILDDCTGAELACLDNPGTTEKLTLSVEQNQNIVVVIDGAIACGTFQFRAGMF